MRTELIYVCRLCGAEMTRQATVPVDRVLSNYPELITHNCYDNTYGLAQLVRIRTDPDKAYE